MKTAAVICEYNPFHNGHKYQLENIKKNHDAIICVMSGSFVQRGDVAIYDKWTRAKAALLSGADLVVELPVVFALNTAQRFAFGGISLLNSMNIVNSLVFGSECGDIDSLIACAKLMLNEPENVSEKIRELMNTGLGYPTAQQIAYETLIPREILSNPNNILALEYIKQLLITDSNIKPVTLKRHMNGYHDLSIKNSFASATAIRNIIDIGKDFSQLVPPAAEELYSSLVPLSLNGISSILNYLILTKSTEELALINDVGEGLENRIKQSAGFNTLNAAVNAIKSKRYTESRIRRCLLSIVLDIDKKISHTNPKYLRVLGANTVGIKLLSEIKRKSDLTVITKAAAFKNFDEMFKKDILASDIISVLNNKKTGLDFTTSPVIIKE